jgi:iron complex transport system ATP-binding protein
VIPAIQVFALSVRVGSKPLLDGVSLSIGAGETVALVGPNGAGKSTLLRALSGEIPPSAGAVSLWGRSPSAYRPRELAYRRAVLSQSVSVSFPFTVAEVVRMGAGTRGGPAVEAMVDAALAEVDLGGFRDRIVGSLSGGEQQRAHLARVLVQVECGAAVHGPGLLLLDEPTASLDLRHQLDVVAAVRRRSARGIAAIAVLHDLNLAALFAPRVVVMGGGRIAADGPSHDTITEDVLRTVFGVEAAVGRVPERGRPFVLPHDARRAGEAGLGA